MESIAFNHETHRRFYYRMLKRSGDRNNPAVRALFYVLGIGKETRINIEEIFDFEHRRICPETIYADWQSWQSARTTRIAFHLWDGYIYGTDSVVLTPRALFNGPFAHLYAQAFRLRYPDLFGSAE